MLSFVHRLLHVPYTMYVRSDIRPEGKARATVVFIHGIGNTGRAWDKVITNLPVDLRLVSVDLLGFGKSRKPEWLRYDVSMQARSLYTTLYKLRIRGPVILVGHSLGSIIAVEFAKRYPGRVQSLILCSPPFYQYSVAQKKTLRLRADDVLKDVYDKIALGDRRQFLKLAALASKYQLIGPSFSVTDENIASYMATLSASIVQQTSLQDAEKLDTRVRIIHGTFDPVVVPRNLKHLKKQNPQVTVKDIAAGHEIKGRFIPVITEAVLDASLDT